MNQQSLREWTLSVQAQKPTTSQASERHEVTDRHQDTLMLRVPYSFRTAFPLQSDLDSPGSETSCLKLASCIFSFFASFPLICSFARGHFCAVKVNIAQCSTWLLLLNYSKGVDRTTFHLP